LTSAFGWLDTDAEQRRGMLEVIDLFREVGTLDELGIGAIRDALSNTLFPGTSTLHRRLRYVLFTPWLLQIAAKQVKSPEEMRVKFRKLEVALIASLLNGGESVGVIGKEARERLVHMPSSMYWSALGAWGIRDVNSIADYYRRQHGRKALKGLTTDADDKGARDPLPSAGLDIYLPDPPSDLLKRTTFTLESKEANYLSDLIVRHTQGTALAWLILNPPRDDADYVWEIDNLDEAPEEVRVAIDHARRFSLSIRGATILYHLLIAEKAKRDEDAHTHREQLAEWRRELLSANVLVDWDHRQWRELIRQQDSRIQNSPTQRFLDEWIDLASRPGDLANDERARELITARESQVKGARAPLANQSALDRWKTGGPIPNLNFRWRVAQSHVKDLVEGRAKT
jgi:hypothetical protein